MSKLDETRQKLTELGIEFSEDMSLKELRALLPEEIESEDSVDEIKIGDPEILRPKELPLVVELPKSASKAQIAYAKILNAYAYKNPVKWSQKKKDIIKDGKVVVKGFLTILKELKDAPDPIENPENGTINYKNHLIQS